MTNDIEKRAEELAARPYSEVVFRDRTTTGGYMYVALTPELEGCMVQGETLEEAKANLRLFRIDYIQHLLENNLPIPDPAWMLTETQGNGLVEVVEKHRHVPEEIKQPPQHETLHKAQMSIKNDEIEYA
jgi:predicted RNase H-like HicB family nuclease